MKEKFWNLSLHTVKDGVVDSGDRLCLTFEMRLISHPIHCTEKLKQSCSCCVLQNELGILINFPLFFRPTQWHHSLEILDISSNSRVSDQSMELLSDFGMPKLYSLDLGSTNVTAEGVR